MISENSITIAIVVFCVLLLVSFITYIRRYYLSDDPSVERLSENDVYEVRGQLHNSNFSEPVQFNSLDPYWSSQSQEWQEAMGELGQQLYDARVRATFFIHGTFVGHDPFDVSRLLEGLLPKFSLMAYKNMTKNYMKRKDLMMGDRGYFSTNYLDLFSRAMPKGMQCERFEWSSGNHHFARVSGCFELIDRLAQVRLEGGSKLLLIGHSHGGQLFALMTQLIANPNSCKPLLDLLAEAGVEYDSKRVLKQIDRIKKYNIDFVTLGTPRRYRWNLQKKHRLLHFINFRQISKKTNFFKGLLRTLEGDYIQRWGVDGSDSPSPLKKQALANIKFNEILGVGLGPRNWQSQVAENDYLPRAGEVVLIDYADHSETANFLTTSFGHLVYTRYNVMLYNIKEIVTHLYS